MAYTVQSISAIFRSVKTSVAVSAVVALVAAVDVAVLDAFWPGTKLTEWRHTKEKIRHTESREDVMFRSRD